MLHKEIEIFLISFKTVPLNFSYLNIDGPRIRVLQQVIPDEVDVPDFVAGQNPELLDSVYLVVLDEEVQDLRQSQEHVLPDDAEVRMEDMEVVHVAQTPERVRVQGRQVHVSQFEDPDVVEAVEGVCLDSRDTRRYHQMLHIRQPRERF